MSQIKWRCERAGTSYMIIAEREKCGRIWRKDYLLTQQQWEYCWYPEGLFELAIKELTRCLS